MILSDIKRYLQAHKQVTLGELALHFDTDPEAMRGMVDQWIRKGKVIQTALQSNCGGSCGKRCCAAAMEIYAWQTQPAPNAGNLSTNRPGR